MNYSETKIRVRYGETDKMGVVYHANYANYFEIGRTEWLRNLGITYDSMEKSGIMLPVISLQIDYKNSAFYDDLLTLKTTLLEPPTVRIKFQYELKNQSEVLLAVGRTDLVFMDIKKHKPIRCPNYLLDKLQK